MDVTASVRAFFPSRTAFRDRHAFPVILQRRNIYLFPTRQGLIFFSMLFVLLFGSVNHNNNLGFFLTFLLSGMSLVSVFHTYRNISGLTLITSRAKPVFAGQQAAFDLIVSSPRQSRQALSFSFAGERKTTLDFPRDSRQPVRVFHAAGQRGFLKPGVLRISTTYPLGLFKGWSNHLLDTSCLVYPKPIAGPVIAGRMPETDENEGDTGGYGAEDFIGLDTYQPGDSLQHIAWKASSRGQGLFTKKFAGQHGGAIFFDPAAMPGSDLERKLSRICFMILTAENLRTPYGLKIGSHIIAPAIGGPHRQKCLRALALAGIDR